MAPDLAGARHPGRVGALAATLGLGAALLAVGCGIAAADTSDESPAAPRVSAGGEATGGGATKVARGSRGRTAPATDGAPARVSLSERARSRAVSLPAVPAPGPALAAEPAAAFAAEPTADLVGSAVEPAAGATDAASAPTPSDAVRPRAAAAAATPPGLIPLPELIPTVCTESSEACAYLLGASGVPIPTEEDEQVALAWYLQPNSPGVTFSPQVIYTPEGAYPITGVKNLPIDPSSQQGLTEVRATFEATLQVLQPGTPISYFGYSQSAIISSLLQIYQQNPDCAATGSCPPPAPPAPGEWPIEGLDPDQLTIVTVGQEMNPNGGWFSRFTGFITPGPGLVFYGPTPEEPWAGRTVNYTLEYDGFADYPRYPLNFLSSLNAALGIVLVHTRYLDREYFNSVYGVLGGDVDPLLATFGPAVACQDPSSTCRRLPTTPGTEDTQEYYFIPTPNLPLLAPLRVIPLIGEPLADLIQPVLKVIVDLGYADWAHGFGSPEDQPPANVLVEFGVFPDVNPLEVIGKLIAGVGQGVGDFIADLLPGGSVSRELSAMGAAIGNAVSNAVSAIAQFASQPLRLPTLDDVVTAVQGVVSQVTSRIANAASALYATLLPLADFANASLISLPGYAVNLFIDGIAQALSGQVIEGLINAVGRPIAAAVGFAGIIGVFQLLVFALGLEAAITGCGRAAPVTGLCISDPFE